MTVSEKETIGSRASENLEDSFWGNEILSGRIEQWERKARLRSLRWAFVIRMALLLKRLLDIVGSIFAIIVSAPITIFTCLAIKLNDGGPVLFKQLRVGESGRLFKIWKFRSMVLNADQIKDEILEQNQHADGVTFKMKDDPRITKPGKWIRKLSIDEFPQFINVLKGDMSLVGPRPPVPREVALYGARHLRRLRAKPGITCLWQIGGRADIDFEGQVRLDLQYIHSQSVRQDIIILLKTIPAVLLGKGAY
ncbi:MAG: sugar transferase [Verrucomicrobiota bacterium]